jgi:hypothetical protein
MCVLSLLCFGTFVRYYAGFVGFSCSACGVSCVLLFSRCGLCRCVAVVTGQAKI